MGKKHSDLVCIKFDIDERHPLMCITVMLKYSVHSLRDIFHDQIQEKLIFSCCRKEAVLQRYHIWVIHQAH